MSDIAPETLEAGTITVFYEGTRFVPVPVGYTKDHGLLLQFLTSNGISVAANAKVKERENGDLELIKQAGPNGSLTRVLSELEQEAIPVNPAIALAYELRQRQEQGLLSIDDLSILEEHIGRVIETAHMQSEHVVKILSAIKKCPSKPSHSILV